MKGNFLMKQFLLAVLLSTAGLACAEQFFERVPIRVGETVFSVELAVSPAQRERGLMFRESLPLFSGMLFVFDSDQVLSFWMKNTSIPLSIAFINAGGESVAIRDLEPFSTTPVSSGVPVRYALEVNRNVFARQGIRPGHRLDLTPVLQPTGFPLLDP